MTTYWLCKLPKSLVAALLRDDRFLTSIWVLRRAIRRLSLSLLIATAYGSNPLASFSAQQSTAEPAIIRSFLAAFEQKDLTELTKFWDTASPEFPAFNQRVAQVFASTPQIRIPGFKLIKNQTQPSELWLWLDLEVSGNEKTTGKLHPELGKMKRLVIHCRQQAGQWKIWRCLPAYEHLAWLLLSVPSGNARSALLEEHREFAGMDLAIAITARGNSLSTSNPPDYPAAIEAFRLAYNLAFRAGERKRAFVYWENIGNSFNRMGKPDDALREYEQGLTLSRSLEETESASRFLNRMALVLTDLGKYHQAHDLLEECLNLQETLNQPAIIAQTELLLGQLDYLQGNYWQSFARIKRGQAIREKLLLQDQQNQNLRYSLALAVNSLGILYFETGAYAPALQHFEKSLALSQTAGRDVENLLLNIGTVYEKQGNDTLAIEYYRKDLEVSRKRNSRPAIAQSLINIGLFQHHQGEAAEALTTLREALTVSTEIKHPDLRSKALNLIGSVYLVQKHYAAALDHYSQSLTLREQINDREGIADTAHNLALTYAEQNDYARAVEFAQRAAVVAQQIGKPDLSWRINTTLGRIRLTLNQPEQSRSAWEIAIETIESLRGNLIGGEAQTQAFFDNKTAPYLALAELFLAQNNAPDALTYAERAKARTLLDVLQSGKLNLAKAMTAVEQSQERQFNNELVALNTQLYREQTRETPDQQRLTALSAQVDKARLNYEDFRTRLYAAHPELKVQRGEAQPLTLAEAGALLPDARTALLEFVVLPERVQLFVITKTKTGAAQLQVFPLAVKREELSAKVAQFRQQLADRDQRFGRLARELYTLLLQPARAVLPPQTRLLIVPDGPLWELPFQALQKANNQYLWAEHVIAYAPSLTVLREMAKLKPAARVGKGKPSFFAIGDPALGGAGVERMKQLMAPVGGAFEQLPEARAQVETVRRFYDPARSRVLTGAAATEAVLKAEAGKYDVLHLATHGVLNDRNPLYSHVLLAQTESGAQTGEQTEDGLLETWELMQMDLKAELAVLSACETARGRVGAGEGMIGLTWALFVAGVPTTIVSQWKVRADSTADLMVEFHRHWQTRPMGAWAKAEALQQAALRVQRDTRYQHPFYWAGFVLVGKTQ